MRSMIFFNALLMDSGNSDVSNTFSQNMLSVSEPVRF